MNFINLTPHAIVLNDGRTFKSSEKNARVSTQLVEIKEGFYSQTFGEITDLPKPINDTLFIVSGMVKSATTRTDVIAPATSHKDTKRNDKGHIISVPGFIL